MLFTSREKIAKQQQQNTVEFSHKELLVNNSRAKPSASNVSLDPTKNPISSVCSIIFIVGENKALPNVLSALNPLPHQSKQSQCLNP